MNSDRLLVFACFGICVFLASATPLSADDGQNPADQVTFTTLANFNFTNGQWPEGPLVQGTDGNLYGTTFFGGTNGSGTVFKTTPSGTLTTLYNFCSQPNCADGSNPVDRLVLSTDGNFYGVTGLGGGNAQGTFFRVTPEGVLTTIYNWCSLPNCADGTPEYGQNQGTFVQAAAFIQGKDGYFYGTNSGGGTNGAGTVYKLGPSGTLTTLYTFCTQSLCADGANPTGLMQASDGNFYGITIGTVFKITPGGTFTTLYSFCAPAFSGFRCTDGTSPFAPLVQAADGNLYGTTTAGGAGAACPNFFSCGTVFKITLAGVLTTVYNFCSQANCADGGSPFAPLVQGTDGNFYGTTSFWGANGGGTIFRLTQDGVLTTLYNVDNPLGFGGNGVIQATNGNFYGTVVDGGPANSSCVADYCGILFELAAGLGPFVEPLPAAGRFGERIVILGSDLTGATSVSFGDRKAPFKVISPTEIETIVPGGIAAGLVTVTTPSGVLQSNVQFRVLNE
jgi:uncharacterized repeat protein (TIGR03803 family)